MDRRTWWATVHGVAKNRIQLSWVIFHCIHAIEHSLSNITVIKVYAQATNARETEVEWFCEDLQDLLELTPKKECPFHHRGLEWKSSKSRVNLSNWQVWPGSTKWSREKANKVLPRERTGYSKQTLPTTQETTLHMDITRWSTPK